MAKSVRKQAPSKSGGQKVKPAKSPENRTPTGRRRKADWEANHQLIKESYYELLRLRKRAPKISEIAERVGLSYRTVERHIEELDLQDLTKSHPVRLMIDEVITGVAKAAIGGSARNAELYFELVFGHVKTGRTELTGKDGGPVEMGVDFDKAVALIQQQLRSQSGGSDGSETD